MDAATFFSGNLVPCAGLLFLLFFLRENQTLNPDIKRNFYHIIILEFIEMAAYNAELWTAAFSKPTVLRILLSAIGYSLRPIFVYMLLMIELRYQKRCHKKIILAVPLVINAVIAFSALFTDIAYFYDARNVFHRGPLGYSSQFTMFLYLIIIWGVIFRNLEKGNRMEKNIIWGISAYLMGAMAIEAIFLIQNIGRTAIVLSTIIYYMFFQTKNFRSSLDEEQQLRENAEEKAQIDSLTGILNRESFFKMAQKAITASDGEYVAFLFMDIDHFKEVNDQLGHLTGDHVLIDVTQKIKRSFREYDIIGRFGGDEFCALLKNISYDVLCKRLDAMLDCIRSEYTDGTAVVRISVSIGTVYFKSSPELKLFDILDLADTAVYKAKNTGRDRYVINCLNCD